MSGERSNICWTNYGILQPEGGGRGGGSAKWRVEGQDATVPHSHARPRTGCHQKRVVLCARHEIPAHSTPTGTGRGSGSPREARSRSNEQPPSQVKETKEREGLLASLTAFVAIGVQYCQFISNDKADFRPRLSRDTPYPAVETPKGMTVLPGFGGLSSMVTLFRHILRRTTI